MIWQSDNEHAYDKHSATRDIINQNQTCLRQTDTIATRRQ